MGSTSGISADHLISGVSIGENLRPGGPTVLNHSLNTTYEYEEEDSSFSNPNRNLNLTCLADQLNNLHLGTPCPPKKNPFSSANTFFTGSESGNSSYKSAQNFDESESSLSVSGIEISNGLKTPCSEGEDTFYTNSEVPSVEKEESTSGNKYLSAKSSTDTENQVDDAISSDLSEGSYKVQKELDTCDLNRSKDISKLNVPENSPGEEIVSPSLLQEEPTSQFEPSPKLHVENTQSENCVSSSGLSVESEQAATHSVKPAQYINPENRSRSSEEHNTSARDSTGDSKQVRESEQVTQQPEETIAPKESPKVRDEKFSELGNGNSPPKQRITALEQAEKCPLNNSEQVAEKEGEDRDKKPEKYTSPPESCRVSPPEKGTQFEVHIDQLKQSSERNSTELTSDDKKLGREKVEDSSHAEVINKLQELCSCPVKQTSPSKSEKINDAQKDLAQSGAQQTSISQPKTETVQPTENSGSAKAGLFEQSLDLDPETVRSLELFKASKKKSAESDRLSLDSEKQETFLDTLAEPDEFSASWNSEAGPATAAEEIFCDPASFDFLVQRGNNNISSNLYKKSLFVRFDPLVNAQSPTQIERHLTASLKMADNNCGEEIQKSQSKKSLSPVRTPLKNPALEAVGKLIEASPSVPGVDSSALEADLAKLRELLVQQEKEYKEKIKKLEKNEAKLEKEISEKNKEMQGMTRSKEQMNAIVVEYEKTITQMVSHKEGFDSRLKAVENERDTAAQHLNNLEIAFNDVHQKYERCKAVIESLKQEYDAAIKKQENKYEMLKQHAKSQLEKANQELDVRTKSQEAESAKLRALLKKAELRVSSLEITLEQKTKENQELMKICDELINKVGSS
ncbi:uncharacterized protein [Bemisia tabaci]|uniref:uncharacterized protein isoform X2 n=1 Tax=Bemisia tabaci TaxID=7038 RepID=UPI003B27D5E3